jgi:hypothetical protein
VRLRRPVPRGTILWCRDLLDRVYTPEEKDRLPRSYRAILDRYGYRDAAGRTILCWDAGRLVNHSCRPAMRGVGPDVMIAVRNLPAGDEVTCDYAECNLTEPMTCRCRLPECRRRIRGDDLLRLSAAWDEEVHSALPDVLRVPQPLWSFLLEPDRFGSIARGETRPPSLRTVSLAVS